jgi:hypothetical protein
MRLVTFDAGAESLKDGRQGWIGDQRRLLSSRKRCGVASAPVSSGLPFTGHLSLVGRPKCLEIGSSRLIGSRALVTRWPPNSRHTMN